MEKASRKKSAKIKRKSVGVRPGGRWLVLVDGSNVLFGGGSKPRVENLQLVMRKLEGEGHRYIVFIDASARHKFGGREKPVFERMISRGIVQQVPAHTPADRWILEYAGKHPEYKILSNDTFRGWESKFPLVRDRDKFITFMIINGEVMLAEREAGLAPEKVDTNVLVVDGGEIPVIDLMTAEDFFTMEKENKFIDARSLEPCIIRGAIMSSFRRGIRTVGVKAYGRCIPKVKKGAEMVVARSAGNISIEKTIPISGEGIFETHPGIQIILRKHRERRPAGEDESVETCGYD